MRHAQVSPRFGRRAPNYTVVDVRDGQDPGLGPPAKHGVVRDLRLRAVQARSYNMGGTTGVAYYFREATVRDRERSLLRGGRVVRGRVATCCARGRDDESPPHLSYASARIDSQAA